MVAYPKAIHRPTQAYLVGQFYTRGHHHHLGVGLVFTHVASDQIHVRDTEDNWALQVESRLDRCVGYRFVSLHWLFRLRDHFVKELLVRKLLLCRLTNVVHSLKRLQRVFAEVGLLVKTQTISTVHYR